MAQNTLISTVGGTLFAVASIPFTTVLTTVILAIIGAVVSFGTTLLLKWAYNKWLNPKTKIINKNYKKN